MPSRLSTLRNPSSTQHAKALRREMTDAEMRLWYHLRAGRFLGYKFKRQVPIGNCIVDFLCEAKRLVVEVDGGQHEKRAAQDAVRTRALETFDYRVVRYWNHEVLGNTAGVLEDLARKLETR